MLKFLQLHSLLPPAEAHQHFHFTAQLCKSCCAASFAHLNGLRRFHTHTGPLSRVDLGSFKHRRNP